MFKKLIILLISSALLGCVVMPEVDRSEKYSCALSSDKKYLKVANLMDGDTSFYEWQDEMLSIITFPTTAIISTVYVAVNNVYHIGEKQIKCGKKN